MIAPLDCKNFRRFGVEIEVNTLDGEVVRPDANKGEIPKGSDLVASIVKQAVNDSVVIAPHHLVYNNNQWIIKPDNSCGIEINSPILKGWIGLKKLMLAVDYLGRFYRRADRRCSLHVHVNIADLTPTQLASVIAYYVKCEHVLFDSMPPDRKNNRYCQLIGMTDIFSHSFVPNVQDLIVRMSEAKYTSLNTFHFVKGGGFNAANSRKKTIEFRILGNDGCYDPWVVKNWVRFLLYFVDTTKNLMVPPHYEKGNPWSGLLWLNPRDVLFKVLRFNEELSPGLTQVFHWLLARIARYGYNSNMSGVWSNEGRAVSRNEFMDLLHQVGPDCCLENDLTDIDLYGEKYVF